MPAARRPRARARFLELFFAWLLGWCFRAPPGRPPAHAPPTSSQPPASQFARRRLPREASNKKQARAGRVQPAHSQLRSHHLPPTGCALRAAWLGGGGGGSAFALRLFLAWC